MQRPVDAQARGGPQRPAADPARALRWLRAGRCVVIAAPGFETAALPLGLLEAGGLGRLLAAAGGPRGRARSAVVELPEHAARMHLRPLRHGGVLRGLWGGSVLGPGRPARELAALVSLRARGLPVPRPVLVAAQRRRSGVWSAALGTVFEEGSVDAAAFLAAAPDARRLLRACAAAGRALRRLHDEGARHRDLHAGNLLLRETPQGCEVLVVDLDRVRLGAPPDARGRMAEIARLYRSLVKRGSAGRVGARGCAAFLASYTGGDRNLRAALRAQLPRERRRLALHRLGYRLLPP